MKTLVRIEFGSHLYGTSTPQSDLDYKAVHLPRARDIILQRVQNSVSNKPLKTVEGQKNEPGDYDEESYSLQRFLYLVKEGQTVALDMLFAPKQNLLATSDVWGLIQENRSKLLTRKSAAFVGYCRQQANKYGIKGSRVAAAKMAMEGFTEAMSTHGPLTKVRDIMGDRPRQMNEHMRIVDKETTAGRFETYFECCNRMVGFNNTVKEAAQIYTRIYEEYGKRAKQAEQAEGIDWKALSHAVRVGREAVELLSTGHITFPLPYAAHVLQVKRGELPYEEVAEEIERLLEETEKAADVSSLPDKVDELFIEDLVYSQYRKEVEICH